jgi:hypothetical protein
MSEPMMVGMKVVCAEVGELVVFNMNLLLESPTYRPQTSIQTPTLSSSP